LERSYSQIWPVDDVDDGICPHCGGPNPIGAAECQWCGAAIPGPPPLDFSRLPSANQPTPEPEEDTGPSGFTIARVVFAVIVAVIIVAIALTIPTSTPTSGFGSSPPNNPPNTVNVTQVVVNVPTNACGLSGITPGAFSVPAYTAYPFGWWLPWSGPVPCTVSNVTSDTPGFSVGNGNFPLTVTSAQTPLLFEVYCPASYSGVLTLTVL
jgi:hypothetical protein